METKLKLMASYYASLNIFDSGSEDENSVRAPSDIESERSSKPSTLSEECSEFIFSAYFKQITGKRLEAAHLGSSNDSCGKFADEFPESD